MKTKRSNIYTRKGDSGTTGLGDGTRVQKSSARIEAIGTVDELNSALGVLAALEISAEIRIELTEIQRQLFALGADLATPRQQLLPEDAIDHLEQKIFW